MSCELCGRNACTRSFHSLEEQEEFDTKTGRYAPDEDEVWIAQAEEDLEWEFLNQELGPETD